MDKVVVLIQIRGKPGKERVMAENAGGATDGLTTEQPVRENKWAERREDYALRFVPLSYRRWSWISLLGVMLGISTAMFFLAFGGQLVQAYGTQNLLIGMILGSLFIGAVGYFFASVSSITGLDSDLTAALTRVDPEANSQR